MEDIVERELRERLASADFEIELRPLDLEGQVMLHCDLPEAELREIALSLRSCFHVIRHIGFLPMAEPEPLEGLEADLADLDIAEMRAASRFRVTTQRSGEHEFGSMDAQRVAGAALVERYGTAVNLEDFDTEVRVDAIDDTWLVGVQWTRTSLDKRYSWVYRPRVTLRTTIAYGLLRLAELPPPTDTGETTVLDPFCGSGTILIEAASIRDDLRCLGADRDPEAVEGTRANADALGLAGRIEIREADARDLAQSYAPASVDAVVTNPPYGIRLGRRTNYTDLYRSSSPGPSPFCGPAGESWCSWGSVAPHSTAPSAR